MKVRYRTNSGSESTAYLDDGGSGTHTGFDKYTDEPLTVRWDGSAWIEDGSTPVRPASSEEKTA